MNVYLDNNATTPLHPEVKEAIISFLDYYGNPSSMHETGRMVKEKIEESKNIISQFLGAKEEDLIFTSCGSESNNTVLKSLLFSKNENKQLITSKIEHPSVIETARFLKSNNIPVSFINVNKDGLILFDELEKELSSITGIVSIMYANNEIGTIQPINQIASIIKEKAPNAIFHTDLVQAIGKVKINLSSLPIDAASISAHKLYAPKGLGLLYIRDFSKMKKNFTPLIHGGHQEQGFRAGTENTLGIVALAAACKALTREMDEKIKRIKQIRDYFEFRISSEIDDIIINGKNSPRLCGTSNVTFKFVEGESILLRLDLNGFSVSTGSACSTGSLEPSHVLMALYNDPELAHGSIRFSFGRENTRDDVDRLVTVLKKEIGYLRSISPLKDK
jgi:cysteine desulfurase